MITPRSLVALQQACTATWFVCGMMDTSAVRFQSLYDVFVDLDAHKTYMNEQFAVVAVGCERRVG